MIGWRKIWKKILKPWKGVLCLFLLPCLSVCPRATEHTFWPKNLILGLKDPWDMRKKRILFCFSKFLKNDILGSFLLVFYPFLFHYLCCYRPHNWNHSVWLIRLSLLIIWGWDGWFSLTALRPVKPLNVTNFGLECQIL